MMSFEKFLGRNVAYRLTMGVAAMALCFFMGCGNLGGCEFTPGNENENSANDNDGGAGGNDNVVDNENDNVTDNENDNEPVGGNENDNTGGGTGNDNSGGGTGNDNEPSGNDNAGTGNDNGTSNANDNGTSNSNANGNDNTISNQNTNGGGGGTGGNPVPISVKSVTTQPSLLVILTYEEDLAAACDSAAVWSQTGGPNVGAIVIPGDGSGRFTAPARTALIPAGQTQPVTTNLTFSVSIPANCVAGSPARTGTTTVPVQVANLAFDLPATITLNTPLNLAQFTMVSGTPAQFLTLYMAEEPLPAGVDLDINQFTSTMEVFAGVGQAVEITVQVIAAAGTLAEATDVVQIVNP